MIKKKLKLPNFTVRGTINELIKLETLMILLGYRSDEAWNRIWINKDRNVSIHTYAIDFYARLTYMYYSPGSKSPSPSFKAIHVSKILKFIEAYQHKTNN